MKQYSCNIIVKDTWIMPKANEETTLTLQEPSDLLVGCWLWNPSVGYLEVTKYSGYDIYVTVKNLKMEENAREGTIFPSCMEMLVIAPNATPILDNNVTCLSADFISPEEGSTALMKVVDSSAIKAADLIIVDNKYQYVVIQVIDEHTLEVLNEGKGAEGIIKIDCTGCVSVKIFESTYCCKVLQEQVDDIYDTLNDRHSIKAWTGNNLVTISGGNDALIAPNDVTVKVDNDLSKYDNTISKFTSLIYFKEQSNSYYAWFLPDVSTGNSEYCLGSSVDTFNNAWIDSVYSDNIFAPVIQGGLNKHSKIIFNSDGSDTEYRNGTTTQYNAHAFYSGNVKVFTIGHDQADSYVDFIPRVTNLNIGSSDHTWGNVYTDSITLNGTTYTSIPTPITPNNGTLTIYNSDGVTEFLTFTADQAGNTTATLPSLSLTYFEESYDSGTNVATWKPVWTSGASSFNLGTPSNYFKNAYISDGINNAIKIQHLNGNAGYITSYNGSEPVAIGFYSNGLSSADNFIKINKNSYLDFYNTTDIRFIVNSSTNNISLSVGSTKVDFYANPIPHSNSVTLGDTSNYWNNAYINKINVTSTSSIFINSVSHLELKNTVNSDGVGLKLTLGNNEYAVLEQRSSVNDPYGASKNVYYAFNPNGSNRGSIGKPNAYWHLGCIKNIFANNIMPVDGNFADGGANGAGDLGAQSHKWAALYIVNINGSPYSPSDRDKKENIVERGTQKASTKSLDKLLSLKTYNYTLKEDVTKQERIGIMAQELRELEPSLVVDRAEEGSKKEDLYYDLTSFVTMIMEAVKELAQDVADLKKALNKGEDDEYKEVSEEK